MALSLYRTYKIQEGIDLAELQTFDETDYYTTAERLINSESYINFETIYNIVKSPIIKKYTKIYLLRDDETIKKDITKYVANTGTITKNNNSGQCRSTSLTFHNPTVLKEIFQSDYSRKPVKATLWNPLMADDDFAHNAKIQIVSGFIYQGLRYEVSEGIFVTHDPKMNENNANSSITIQLYDKFALLDGTIDGKNAIDYQIPRQTPIYQAITQLLRLPKNNQGEPYDLKEIEFPPQYRNELLAYTIKKTGENNIGDLIKDMVKTISCDVRYDAYGHLVISDTLKDLDVHHRSMSWNYSTDEYDNPAMNINYSKIKNDIIVIGNNINGYLCKGEAKNTNAESLYNVNSGFGIKSKKITDNLIPSNKLCAERARYELQKATQDYITLTFSSVWIPHLEPDDLIRWTKPEWNIYEEEFIVNSISLSLDSKATMSLNLTNTKELSY